MGAYTTAAILAAYGSLLVELTVFRVPSVASSVNIWAPTTTLLSGYSPAYQRFFRLAKPLKLLIFMAPLSVVYGIYLYPLLVIFVGPDLLNDYLFAPTPPSGAGGIALMLVGRATALSSVMTIRQRNRQQGESFHLHTTGPFRWSRNPGLVGMYLFVAGVWVTMPSAIMLAGIVLYVAHMGFKVRMEEDFLSNKFGEEYADYRLRTGRYLP